MRRLANRIKPRQIVRSPTHSRHEASRAPLRPREVMDAGTRLIQVAKPDRHVGDAGIIVAKREAGKECEGSWRQCVDWPAKIIFKTT